MRKNIKFIIHNTNTLINNKILIYNINYNY